MLRFHLNLATNPFVNLRKYYLIGGLLLALGLAGAAYFGGRYITLRRNSRATIEDLQSKRQDLGRLTAAEEKLTDDLRQPATLDEIDRVNSYNNLIQRKTFPWTQFFEDLESVIPYNVEITQIRQRPGTNVLNLEMVFLGRTSVDAIHFLKNLENSNKFQHLLVDQEGKYREAATHEVSNDVEVVLHLEYHP